MIKTVLFTDIVGSTELASKVGDRQWRQVLAMHHAFIRGLLKRHGGREVDTAGDGFFATFDQPLRAIRCASDIVDGLWTKGLQIRAGAHVGQVEATGPGAKVGGVAVHIGSRVASLAAPGEVLVSGTLKDLVTGSEVEFADRGEHPLKGVPGTWRLFAVARELAPEGIPTSPAPPLAEQGVAARPRRRRGVLVLAGLALAGLLASLALVLVRPAVTPLPDSVGRLDAATNQFVAAVPVGRHPAGLAAGAGSLWVLNVDDQTVSRIDPGSNQVIATRAVGGTPTAIAFGSNSVWVAAGFGLTSGTQGSVLELDPATNELSRPIPLGNGLRGMAFGFGSIWVTNVNANTVTRIDADTGELIDEITVGEGPEGIAVGADAVWVANALAASVTRIDPETNRVTAEVPLREAPNAIAAGQEAVWVASTAGNVVIRIDPLRAAIVTTIEVPAGPVAIVQLDTAVWVAASIAGGVARIDTQTNSQSAFVPVGGTPWQIVAWDDALWVSVRP
jgi:YVTN family beta-propeller protein